MNCLIAAIIIQSAYRSYLYRRNNLPNSIRLIGKILSNAKIQPCKLYTSGRKNSQNDEDTAIKILNNHPLFNHRIFVPPRVGNDTHWCDFAVRDYQYGWLPVNFKSTTTKSSDNVGNLSLIVYALTNFEMDVKKEYTNGPMSRVFMEKLNNWELNRQLKRDYYFVVLNKTDSSIILNSLKGLSNFTPNLYNLPFQIYWCKNTHFKYQKIDKIVCLIHKTLKKPKPTWQETFMTNIRQFKPPINY